MFAVTLALRGLAILSGLGFLGCFPWVVYVTTRDYETYSAYLNAKDAPMLTMAITGTVCVALMVLSLVTQWLDEEFSE